MSPFRTLSTAAALLATVAAAPSPSPAEAGGGDGTVVIYSGRTQNLIEPILNEFASDTGINVQVRYGDTSDLALLIAEEGDRSPADVFLSQSPGAIGFLAQEGMLASLPDDVLALVPEQFRAADGTWVGLSGRQRVLVYNAELVAEDELPGSVFDLTEPEWAGRLGIAPANASFQDFVTSMRNEVGDDATREWLEGIAANDAFTFANNTAIVAAVNRGEIDVGLVNHYYAHVAMDEDPGFAGRNHFFDASDIGSLVLVTGISLLADAEHPDEAVELIDYLLADEAQRYFSDETYEYPLALGATPNEALPDIDLTAASDIALDLDELAGDLSTTRELIRDAGLDG